MRVLVACEFSGRVRDAFLALGHDAWSCDLEATETPGPHICGDTLDLLDQSWDLLIAHPPCTFLANSGSKHLYLDCRKENGIDPARWSRMLAAVAFFRAFQTCSIPKIAIENPIMHGHAKRLGPRQQSQTIQPWQFGHRETKATCLWLKGLPLLVPTKIVGPPGTPEERKEFAKVHRCPPGPERRKIRSRTYEGIAAAMAKQWG